jgi:hypothetical protein
MVKFSLFLGSLLILTPVVSSAQFYDPALYGTAPSGLYPTVTCTFARNLFFGIFGDDVYCLQQYLNSSGFLVSDYGAGSPGSETYFYGSKTLAAVARWQSANGIFPANGIVGPLSRAKYNSFLGGGTSISGYPTPYPPYSTSPTYPPAYYPGYSGTGLSISPGSQPPSTLALPGSRVPFTRIQLTAPFETDVQITSFTVELRGPASDGAFENISLLDDSNIELVRSRSFDSSHQAIFTSSIFLPRASTKTITIAGNMSTNFINFGGQMPSLAVVSIIANVPVLGGLPIVGNSMTIGSSYFGGGSTQVRVGSFGTFSTSRSIGTDQHPFSSFVIRAGGNDDLRLESIQWYQSGSAASSDLANVVTLVDGFSYPTNVSSDGRSYTTNFGGGVYLYRGSEKEIVLRADIESGSGRTVKFDIERAGDIRVTSYQNNFSVAPTAQSLSSPSISTAEFTSTIPFFDAAQVTIGGTNTLISLGSSPSSQIVSRGTNGFPFATFIFDATSSNDDFRVMTLPIRYAASSNPQHVANCQLSDGSFVLNTGSNIIFPSSSSGNGNDLFFNFDSGFIIPRGSLRTITLRCDISSSTISGATYRFGLQTAPVVTRLQSGTTFTPEILINLGSIMTIAN